MKKILIVSALLLALSAAAVGHDAKADITTNCSPSATDLAQIQAIQNNPTLSQSEELSQEVALRKQLLSQTISCAASEAQTLQQTLNATPVTGDAATIQSQLSGKLDDALNFYQIESGELDGAGLSGTENIAKEVLTWRTSNYEPLENMVNNFILWSENQNLFQTAQNRIMQTEQVVNFIESAATNSNLQSSFNAAQSAFETAQSENLAAESSLAQFLPPNQSLTLIQQSLQSLADTYQKFSDLNGVVQTLLPTNQ